MLIQELSAALYLQNRKKSFVAGADIAQMSKLTKAEGTAFGKKGNDLFLMIEKFPIPVIAAVNGFALGGGCEISMACDFRLASDNAVFGQPETGLGITLVLAEHKDLHTPCRCRNGKTDDLYCKKHQGR